jgi:hypothetical protein
LVRENFKLGVFEVFFDGLSGKKIFLLKLPPRGVYVVETVFDETPSPPSWKG